MNNQSSRNYYDDQNPAYPPGTVSQSGYSYGETYSRGSYDPQHYYPSSTSPAPAIATLAWETSKGILKAQGCPQQQHQDTTAPSIILKTASPAAIASSLHRQTWHTLPTTPANKARRQGPTRLEEISQAHLDMPAIRLQVLSCQAAQVQAHALRVPQYPLQPSVTLARCAGRHFPDLTTGKGIMKHSTSHTLLFTAVVTAERNSAGMWCIPRGFND
ncbi:hypothetical protein VNI00_008585 [Paramarasmius palmivorus]|uniref:Uncharacterized protein n=1 Tax=Paramarasmius palmivorus TaxID=297713 RepID=A0AAW0CTN4_9AGAR